MNGNEKYKYTWANQIKNIYNISGEKDNSQNTMQPFDTPKIKNLKEKKCIILDIHGIIYKGSEPIKSTIDGVNYLQKIGLKVGILTNISAISIKQIQHSLLDMGLKINSRYIMTSAIALINYLLEENISHCLLIGGEPELPKLLKSKKIKITQNIKKIEAVVVGFTKKFTYEQLVLAHQAIQNGAKLICSDADLLYASDKQELPGAGWIVSSISSVCNKEPFVVGKPNDYSLKILLNRMGIKPSETVFVGDSLKSDVLSGKKLGVTTCLQLGGVSTFEEIKSLPTSQRPDYIIKTFNEITEVFKSMSNK